MKIIKVQGIDLTGGRCDIQNLGYTGIDKKSRLAVKKYYKKNGWSVRHNYSRPFIQLQLTTTENETTNERVK